MSAHNHDEEIIKQRFGTKTGNRLQKKVDDKKDDAIMDAIRDAIISTDISGLSRDDAKRKLKNVVDNLFENQNLIQ